MYVGAPAYITQNICVAKGVMNGAPVTLDSITFDEANMTEDEDNMTREHIDELQQRINSASPGEIIEIPVPKSVNVRVKSRDD